MSASSVPASTGELLELTERLHGCIEQLRAGDTQALTSPALSRLVSDTAHLYAGACVAAGREIEIAPEGLPATHAGDAHRRTDAGAEPQHLRLSAVADPIGWARWPEGSGITMASVNGAAVRGVVKAVF